MVPHSTHPFKSSFTTLYSEEPSSLLARNFPFPEDLCRSIQTNHLHQHGFYQTYNNANNQGSPSSYMLPGDTFQHAPTTLPIPPVLFSPPTLNAGIGLFSTSISSAEFDQHRHPDSGIGDCISPINGKASNLQENCKSHALSKLKENNNFHCSQNVLRGSGISNVDAIHTRSMSSTPTANNSISMSNMKLPLESSNADLNESAEMNRSFPDLFSAGFPPGNTRFVGGLHHHFFSPHQNPSHHYPNISSTVQPHHFPHQQHLLGTTSGTIPMQMDSRTFPPSIGDHVVYHTPSKFLAQPSVLSAAGSAAMFKAASEISRIRIKSRSSSGGFAKSC